MRVLYVFHKREITGQVYNHMRQVYNSEIKLRLSDMLFTWDDEKERINFRKHKVHFAVAASAFTDSYVLVENNSVDGYTGEERLSVTGWLAGKIIFIVYVERVMIDEDDILRIISARDANKEERKRYVSGY